ncbi:hypothetical protein [Sulfurimonas autotrophica]|uniref:Uncharacterized protein n=1 Tax=Sulfurimonas autotrophica (strain ATCC BAA-671 / DSM 16294 / JCM 11897 / OK10) TaxID=563040 RepID=E0UUS6_SULAO|nr:hypothetical protein [Sulfurimonas autotrophica]ADN09580.1 conserved hypothetical protein [Sulfurimonas autotrophica DSM 16294]
MAASKKVIENASRLRYIRALQRFQKSILSYLSNSDTLDNEKYNKKIDNALKLLNRVEEVQLYKGELQDLQQFVKKMIAYKDSNEDIDNIKEELLYSANQLEKSKNAKRYKKDKHSYSKYEDWE